MIIIADETFDSNKSRDMSYLQDEKYKRVCEIHIEIKTTELRSLIEKIALCKLFCNHKTLQLYNTEKMPLNIEDNTRYRESLLNKVKKAGVPRIEFSGGLETNFYQKQIDKSLFYVNLKAFLNHYIDKNIIETKILFLGEDYREVERLSIINKMFMQIRILKIEHFTTDNDIKEGLKILYPEEDYSKIIERWRKKNVAKNEIIREINRIYKVISNN